MNRRSFISGVVSLIAAPAIVRASSLMPVRGVAMPQPQWTPTFPYGEISPVLEDARSLNGIYRITASWRSGRAEELTYEKIGPDKPLMKIWPDQIIDGIPMHVGDTILLTGFSAAP